MRAKTGKLGRLLGGCRAARVDHAGVRLQRQAALGIENPERQPVIVEARSFFDQRVEKVRHVVHQRPGIKHYLFDYSKDMEYLEIVSPAEFGSVDCDPVCDVPPPTPWK